MKMLRCNVAYARYECRRERVAVLLSIKYVLFISQNTTLLVRSGTDVSTTCFGHYIGHRQICTQL